MKFLLINNQYSLGNTLNFKSHLIEKNLPHLTIQDTEIKKLTFNELTTLLTDNQITHSLPFLSYGIENVQEIYQVFVNLNIKILNTIASIKISGSKILTAHKATQNNIIQPNYKVTSNYYQDLEEFISHSPLPIIIKRSQGSLGMWVRELRDKKDLPALLLSLDLEDGEEVIYQEKILTPNQNCIRSLVIGGKFVVATTRIPLNGEFRSNVAVNDNQFTLEPSTELIKFSEDVAKIFEIGFVGIDIMIDDAGYKLIEINSFPGYVSMLPYTDIDVTEALFKALLQR